MNINPTEVEGSALSRRRFFNFSGAFRDLYTDLASSTLNPSETHVDHPMCSMCGIFAYKTGPCLG